MSSDRAVPVFSIGRVTALLLLAASLGAAGCSGLGVAAHEMEGEQDVEASYSGLKAQKVGIMVWSDEAIRADHQSIQPDIAKGLQDKLKQAAAANANEVKDIHWMNADDVLRFQEAHPELAIVPAEEVAPRLPVTRLIYIEVVNFSTHPNEAVDLSRGSVVVNLKVIEVVNGKGKIGYTEDGVNAVYPADAPPEGMPGLREDEVYRGAIDKLTTRLAAKFVTHEADAQ